VEASQLDLSVQLTSALPVSFTPLMPAPTLGSARPASSAIAFVDASVAQYQTLTSSIKAGIDVYTLDPLQDGIKQITQVLAGRTGITSLYVLSHGDVGDLNLGFLNLDLSDLGDYSSDLQSWAQSLTADADILLYACNLASGDNGKQFVDALSQLTGADIAASIDLTGNAAQGGNWNLEYQTGLIAAKDPFTAGISAYQQVLATYTEQGAPVLVGGGITIPAGTPTSLNVTIKSGLVAADRLTITPGNGITLDGTDIRFNNTLIGNYKPLGVSPNSLNITFNASATQAAAQALVGQVAFSSVTDALAATGSRTLGFSFNGQPLPDVAVTVTGVNDAPLIGARTVLYQANGTAKPTDAGAATGAPWLTFQQVQGVASQVGAADGTTLTSDLAAYAGYTNLQITSKTISFLGTSYTVPYFVQGTTNNFLPVNSAFPTLDRTQGYTLSFTADLSAEVSANSDRNGDGLNDRAGFSAIVLSSDKKGIELGFQRTSTGQIKVFAQEDGSTQVDPSLYNGANGTAYNKLTLFTQAESALLSAGVVNYDLIVKDDRYILQANGQTVLTGRLRDYTQATPTIAIPFGLSLDQALQIAALTRDQVNPYTKSNFVFLGDDTSDASATVNLRNIALTTGSLPTLTANQATSKLVPNLQVADLDAGTGTVTATLSVTQGILTVNNVVVGGATIGTNGTSSVTLTGSVAQINTTLANATGVTYLGNSTFTGLDTLTLKVDDGGASGGSAQSTTKLLGIGVVPVVGPPQLDLNGNVAGTGYVVDFLQGGAPVAIVDATKLMVSATPTTLGSATIKITNPRDFNFESLAVNTTGTNITAAAYDSSRGILSLTGTDSVANYQKVLRTVTYSNVATIPDLTTRTIEFVVNDGTANSAVATTTLLLTSTLVANQINQYDFSGDGRADLIWRNDGLGKTAVWFINGFTRTGAAFLPDVDSNWGIEAAGDFDGNGGGDLIWRNYVTKEIAIWRMNGTTIAEQAYLPSISFDWQVVGVGDFNGDRKDDLLWRNTVTGENAVWGMNGVNLQTPYFINPLANSNWRVVGVGDFNGDRRADIVWRNDTTTESAIWLLNGSTTLQADYLPSAPVAWQVAAIGDFNGDGKTDLVWRNLSTGQNAVWLMNGTAIAQQDFLTPPVTDQNWQIAATGDFDRDGKVDLLWRYYGGGNDSGANVIWQMDGLKPKATGFTTALADFDWYIS
jgi:Domain of unknown function (DUF4347)/FG-GAP-like repeat